MPVSRQALYIAPDIASSASPPNDMVPKQSSETERPVRPRSFVFMGRVLARGSKTWVEGDEANEKPRQGYLAGCESIPVWGILLREICLNSMSYKGILNQYQRMRKDFGSEFRGGPEAFVS